MSFLALRALGKRFGSVTALDGIDLDVAARTRTAIVGPSGSGKSTLLRIIAGFEAPDAGRLTLAGDLLADGPLAVPAHRRGIGLVFQSYALFPHLTVFENVAFPLRIRSLDRGELERRVAEALAIVHLEGFEKRKPHQLSGGQQQRVALARAIVFKPDILLLDEPLAALDRKLREEVRVEIRRLQRELGITTILVTHDQDEALSLSDHVVVLHQGKVQQIDSPADIYHRPQNRFVADFLGIANFLEGIPAADGIRLASGELAPCAAPLPPGQAVVGVLRPERIRLLNGDGRGPGLAGRISDAVFLGEAVRYAVTLESGHTLVAQSSETRRSYPEGTAVSVDWDPGSVWVLPQPD